MTELLAPELLGLGRIRLRRPQRSDAEGLLACASDPEVVRYMDWTISTSIEPIIERMRSRAERWARAEEFYWVITLPAEDIAIGSISCAITDHSAEVGFFLDRRQWGNGYATDAARAVVDWAITAPTIWRVWATCDCENVASARVLEKAGMSREATLRRWVVRPNIASEPRDAFMYARVR